MPVPRSNWKPSGNVQVTGTNSPPSRASTEFAQTIDTPKPSSPEGATFTLFVAFITPTATPGPSQKDISPLSFSPLQNVTQDLPHQESGAKHYVRVVGFGLLDEDGDSSSLDLVPNSLPNLAKGPSMRNIFGRRSDGLYEQVWDIDEKLKKMAGGNQSTKNTDTGKTRRGVRR